jgi:ATP-dependent Clp protease ATP-binding subunit ClpA
LKASVAIAQSKRSTAPRPDIYSLLTERLVGQSEAAEAILPRLRMFQANLSPERRPAGVFMLLGPTGTGKTHTVEVLAELIHGSDKNFLKVDCGEYQMEHEVAKLIGAPPGYLGHRETQPLLTQARLNGHTSERSGLSLVLFDEVEKAAPSMLRLLLGILDKGTLRLGDNSNVNFERSFVFFTSNIGSRRVQQELSGGFGLARNIHNQQDADISEICRRAAERKFSPEFINRVDYLIQYSPLSRDNFRAILQHSIVALSRHIASKLQGNAPRLMFTKDAIEWLLDRGVSVKYGARELRRVVERSVLYPLCEELLAGNLRLGSSIQVDAAGNELCFTELR